MGINQPKSGKLPPIKLKKLSRPPSAKFTIDCEKNQNQVPPKTVETFLQDLGLLKFKSNFINNGIDNIEKLSYLNNALPEPSAPLDIREHSAEIYFGTPNKSIAP